MTPSGSAEKESWLSAWGLAERSLRMTGGRRASRSCLRPLDELRQLRDQPRAGDGEAAAGCFRLPQDVGLRVLAEGDDGGGADGGEDVAPGGALGLEVEDYDGAAVAAERLAGLLGGGRDGDGITQRPRRLGDARLPHEVRGDEDDPGGREVARHLC